MVNRENHKGQTAMELAVFGAILIFVLGVIIRQAVDTSYRQNQSLKALRLAMQQSRADSTAGRASRNTASLFFIEDRLSPDSGKYGAKDRVPYVMFGSATHSNNLFMPVDVGETQNLPRFDLFVNGQHFPLTTAAFKTIQTAVLCTNQQASCPAVCGGNCGPDATTAKPASLPAANWDSQCAQKTVTRFCRDYPAACPADCTQGCGPTLPLVGGPNNTTFLKTLDVGCATFFTIVHNFPRSERWCSVDQNGGGAEPGECPLEDCGTAIAPGCNLPVAQRFDLDRDGITDVPAIEREHFSWQWFRVMAFDESAPQGVQQCTSFGATTCTPGPAVSLKKAEGINFSANKNNVLDVDGDLKEERIVIDAIRPKPGEPDPYNPGVITQLTVMDSQDGDVDFTVQDSDTQAGVPEPGFPRDSLMQTWVRDTTTGGSGTYLLLEEGKLYDGTGDMKKYIRTAQKKDQIDLIERRFQLHNDEERFCPATGSTPLATVDGKPNPVEVCGGCNTGDNKKKTCYFRGNPASEDPVFRYPALYIRSRLQDIHGRKWVTGTEGDPYVDFQAPSGP